MTSEARQTKTVSNFQQQLKTENIENINSLYSADIFKTTSNAVVQLLSKYLGDAQDRATAVVTLRSPEENMHEARGWLDSGLQIDPADEKAIIERTATLVSQFLANTQTLHHPGYIGHQLPPPLPIASIFEFAADIANQGMAIYELGPWATAVEKVMVQTLGKQLGFQAGTFSGLVTSGGTLANLTALLAARNKLLDTVWKQGFESGKPKPVIITHRESHYSVERAAGILGMGANHCIYVDSDRHGRTDPAALGKLLRDLNKRQIPVVAVVASAGATRTGSFDPLPEIADICEAAGVWLHVDAAHGGAVSFSKAHRHLLDGIERADSVIWDAHKMLFMPTLSTYLFYKNPRDKYVAFSQDAPFLFVDDDAHEYDCGLATAECTKRAAALSLWGVLSVYGPAAFEALIDRVFDIVGLFLERLSSIDQIEIPMRPQFNIVLFRYISTNENIDVDNFNKQLRKFIVETKNIYLTTTTYNKKLYIRFVVMNPRTSEIDADVLIDTISQFAARWGAETPAQNSASLASALEI